MKAGLLEVGDVPGLRDDMQWPVERPMDDTLIHSLIDHTSRIRSPHSFTVIYELGGAVRDLDNSATAFPGRHAAHTININGVWLPDQPIAVDETKWVRDSYNEMRHHETTAYINFLDYDDQDRIRTIYGDEKYQRLVDLKNRYDPDNVFRSNHNTAPSSALVP